jgi:hypothetical protein
MRRLSAGVLALALLASAAAAADIDMAVTLGYQGHYRADAFTPLHVEIFNDRDDTRFLVRIEVKNPQRGFEETRAFVSVPKGTLKAFTFTVFTPAGLEHAQTDASGRVAVPVYLHAENGRLAARAFARGRALYGERLVVSCGTVLSGPGTRLAARNVVWARVPFARLPASAEALEGVDALVLGDPGASLMQDPRLAGHVHDWIRRGGRLVLWARESFFVSPPEGWRRFIPALRGPPAPIEAATDSPLGAFGPLNANRVPSALRFDPEGFTTLAGDGNGAWALQTWEGSGSVAVLGTDPGIRGLRWAAKDRLWEGLLSAKAPEVRSEDDTGAPWAKEFADAVCNQELFEPVEYTLFLIVFVGFAVVVGPLLSLGLGKKRGPWVWFLVPLISGIVSAGTYWFALHDRPGTSHLFQLTFADVDEAGGGRRFTAVLGLVASAGGWYEIELPAPVTTSGGLESEDSASVGVLGTLRGRSLDQVAGGSGLRAYMHPYSARAYRVSGELSPAAQARLGKGFRLRVDSADGLWIRNDTSLTFRGGWVVCEGDAARLPVLSPGEERVLLFQHSLLDMSGRRLDFFPWVDSLVPRRLEGILTGTTYSHWHGRWCPFATAGLPGPGRYLVVALTDEGLAPGTLKSSGETAREVSVVRTVLAPEPP